MLSLVAMLAAGVGLRAQEVTITISPGWTWISCPLMDTLDFETALGSFTPMEGDIIKSHWGYTTYMDNGHWSGGVSQFYPGYCYRYYSNRDVPATVTFHAQQPASQVVVTTEEPIDITTVCAVVSSTVTVGEGNHVFVRGVCWGPEPMPDVDGSRTTDAAVAGSLSDTLTELIPNTTYYVRAYVVTDFGLAYGEELNFNTGSGIPTGVINGLFSVSESQQVYFSQGNLQYQASTNTWRFAENQWDYVGTQVPDQNGFYGGNVIDSDNNNISQTYSGWIDLFGWSTSGYNHGALCYQPWSISSVSTDYFAYGNRENNLYDGNGQADWGYNAILNGGNQENNGWRTLTNAEWTYLYNTRSTASNIRYAKANVNGVNGIILLPDDWDASLYALSNTNTPGSGYNNIITATDWTSIFEANGAVFLPAAGRRYGTLVRYASISGYYWSSSHVIGINSDANDAYFSNGYFNTCHNASRRSGRSVRLVRDAE